MTALRTRAAAVAVVVGPLLGVAVAGAAPRTPSGSMDRVEWSAMVDRIVEAADTTAYRGRVVIVAFDDVGPTLVELDVEQGTEGGLRVGRTEAWMIGRQGGGGYYWKPGTGALLLGDVERGRMDAVRVMAKYDVHALGTQTLVTGDAEVVELREQEATQPRERLFIDEATDLVVRRVTFDGDGAPERLVAFTSLQVTAARLELPASDNEPIAPGPSVRVEHEDLGALREDGWLVPDELDAGFAFRSGYALPEAAGESLHVVYSDGLYTLSVYEQPGVLDPRGLSDGATSTYDEGRHVYRWPGSEPERLVWSGGGMTYTVISDAPVDQVLAAVSTLPHDGGPSTIRRLGRGLHRVGSWLWPFG